MATTSKSKSLGVSREMRECGDILLMSLYEMGHQPVGLASPMAFLRREDYAPAGLDLSVESFDPARVARARFVGLSVPMHTALRLGVRAAARIREVNPSCHICFFGLYASLNVDHLFAHGADSVIGGEYEEALVRLVRALETGDLRPVPGVSFPHRPTGPVLDKLAFPVLQRDGLPELSRYAHLERDGERIAAGYVEASRGCTHLCLHCPLPPVYEGRFFVVPREAVLEDIDHLVEAGAGHITFGDPDFLNAPTHSLRIAREMHRAWPDLSFDFTAKVEHLVRHASSVRELGQLGAVFVVTAVESLSDQVLENLDKGHTRSQVWEALAILREGGIAMRPSWVPFTPWTKLEDYLDMLLFVETERLIDHVNPVQYTIRLLVPPGSLLLSEPTMKSALGPLIPEDLTYTWVHSDPRMDRLHHAVSVLVGEAVAAGVDSALTFTRIKDLAFEVADKRVASPLSPVLPLDRHRPPRLTEDWFC